MTTSLRARVAALERRRGDRERGQWSEETEAHFRRLRRCERTLKQLHGAFARFAEAVGEPRLARFVEAWGGAEGAAAIRNGQCSGLQLFCAFYDALQPAERRELARRRELAELVKAYERRRAAWEDARRHSERWREDRRRERLNGAG